MSLSTVSRVVNKHPHVSPEVVRLVREAMASINYVPPRLRSGRLQGDHRRQQIFALVLPHVTTGSYPSLVDGFGAAAAQLNHQVITCSSKNDLDKQANLILQLMEKGVAGIALAPPSQAQPRGDHQIRHLQKHGIPVAFLHQPVAGAKAPLVGLPAEEVGRRIGQLLLDQGHRRVAFVVGDPGGAAIGFKAGLSQALASVGSGLPDELVYSTGQTSPLDLEGEELLHQTLDQWTSLPSARRPSAIFTSLDLWAELVYLHLMAMGFAVGADISLVSFGAAWRSTSVLPGVPTVSCEGSRRSRSTKRKWAALVSGCWKRWSTASAPSTALRSSPSPSMSTPAGPWDLGRR